MGKLEIKRSAWPERVQLIDLKDAAGLAHTETPRGVVFALLISMSFFPCPLFFDPKLLPFGRD